MATEEPQDFRLELAQKVGAPGPITRGAWPDQRAVRTRLTRCPARTQVFLYKCKDTPAADRKRLQTEILDACFKDGALCARACAPSPTAAFMRRRPLTRVPPGTLHSWGLPACMVAAAAARRDAACSSGLQKPPNRPQPPDAAPAAPCGRPRSAHAAV